MEKHTEDTTIDSLATVHAHYRQRHLDSGNKTLWQYLRKLGLDAETVTRELNIGVSDRTLTHALEPRTLVSGQRQRQQLQQLGILKPSGFETLSGLVLSLHNREGDITNLYSFNYRSRPHTDTFLNGSGHILIKGNTPEAVIVDHPLDIIALTGSGIQHTLIYAHDDNYGSLLENIERVHVLTRKTDIDLPQHHIQLPTENFFQYLRQHKTIPLDTLMAKSTSVVQTDPPANKKENKHSPTESATLTRNGDIHTLTIEDRHYRIGGLHQNNSFDSLRITLRATCQGCIHADTIDLYRDIDRNQYIHRASEELIVEPKKIKNDLGQLILALEQEQETRLQTEDEQDDTYQLTDQERDEALTFLRDPNLIQNLQSSLQTTGIIGETTNTLAAYLACTSRKLQRPLAVIIQSTSAAGKSTLMEAVLDLFPPEHTVRYSSMTGQSLYYLGQGDLQHKILAISEQQGAGKISYALKILQTEGQLNIASTGKNPATGRIETQEYGVEGPVSIILTTTATDLDEELLNRCLLLTVDESQEQTRLIQQHQRHSRTLQGILAKETAHNTRHLMRNIQRLIRPMRIVNPYAEELTFTSGSTRTRRDHEKYLTLIDTIALLHQHQRQTITHEAGGRIIEMLLVTREDILTANNIAEHILSNNLHELTPQTRTLLEQAKHLVRQKIQNDEEPYLTRKELREKTGWSYRQVRRHLEHLQQHEYIQLKKGKNGITMQYQLLVPPEETSPANNIIQLANPPETPPCPRLSAPVEKLANH